MEVKRLSTGHKIRFNWISIMVFLFIVISNDTFFWGTNSVNFFVSFPRYCSIFLCAYLLTKKNVYREIQYSMKIVYCIIMILYLSSCILTKCTITISGIYAIYITLAYFLCTRIRFQEFFDVFEKIIFFICVYSLIIEVIAYLFSGIVSMFPVMINTAGVPITNFGFSGIISRYLNTTLIRNNGIFWEPGVFQIYINLALLYCVFFKTDRLPKRIIVYGLMILFTFSTTGYVAFFFILLITIMSSRIRTVPKIMLSILLGGIIIAALFIDIESSALLSGVFGKVFDSRSGSRLSRVASVVADLEMAKRSPLFGVGMSSIDEEMVRISREKLGIYAGSNSNGLLYQLAAFGVPFEILYLMGMITFPINYTNKKIVRILIFVLIVIIFISERLISPMPYVMMFYGFIGLFNNMFGTRKVETEQENARICFRDEKNSLY